MNSEQAVNTEAAQFRPSGIVAVSAGLNRFFVSIYKIIGFGILTIILLGIVCYVGSNLFYLVHRSWLIPTVISPSDPEVADLRSRIAYESWMRQKVLVDRAELEAKMKKARRVATIEQSFQQRFGPALATSASSSRDGLNELSSLRDEQRQLKQQLAATNAGLAATSKEQLRKDFEANVIDQEQLLAGSLRLSQMAQERLNLEQREGELNEKVRVLERELETFEAAGSQTNQAQPLNYDGLLMRREYDRSVAESEGAADDVQAVEQGLNELGAAVTHYDTLLATLEDTPLLKATEEKLAVAFVPYDNQASVQVGAPVYGCKMFLLFCHRVGTVKGYFEGERKGEHPVYGRELRGQLAELALDEPEWAKQSVLHVNRRPLFI